MCGIDATLTPLRPLRNVTRCKGRSQAKPAIIADQNDGAVQPFVIASPSGLRAVASATLLMNQMVGLPRVACRLDMQLERGWVRDKWRTGPVGDQDPVLICAGS